MVLFRLGIFKEQGTFFSCFTDLNNGNSKNPWFWYRATVLEQNSVFISFSSKRKFKTKTSVRNECYCTFSEDRIAVRIELLLDVVSKMAWIW